MAGYVTRLVMCCVLLHFTHGQAPDDDIDVLKKGCGNNPADIVFVLDESGSIWGPDFDKQINFVKKVSQVFDISEGGTHIGAMTFSDDEVIHFMLGQYSNEEEIMEQLDKIKQRRGGTRTFDAIRKARTTMFSSRYIRPEVPQICILITDGESEDMERTVEEAKQLKDQGVTVFAVGVGYSINEKEVREIASEPKDEYTFTVDKYAALMKLREILAVKACQVTTVPPPTTTTTTTTTTTPIPTLPQMIQGCQNRYEMGIIFALPDQAGINDTDTALDFIANVVDETEMGPDRVQIGLTPRFCNGADGIYLGDHDTKRGFTLNLEQRRLTSTDTLSHLRWMNTEGLSPQNGARDSSVKFGILVVDNEADDFDETLKQANIAKFDMQLIVIGVGDNVNPQQLKAIASDEGSYFQVQDYSELDVLVEDVVHRLCDGIQNVL